MADLGKSQTRQVGNLGNTPAGATGYASSTHGSAYYEAGSKKDAGRGSSRDLNLNSPGITPAGPGSGQTSGAGIHYYDGRALSDAGNRKGKSQGLFGGKGPSDSGATQADAGQLPIPITAGTIYYSMRRTDTGATGGYAHWVNTTGDASGAPAPIGTVGSPVIVTTFT